MLYYIYSIIYSYICIYIYMYVYRCAEPLLAGLCRPSTSAGRDFVTENIIDGTEKQAAAAAARRRKQEAERLQKERYFAD